MKKILLATTILGMSAGFAAAEIAFSGSAAMGIAQDGLGGGAHASNDGDIHAYSTAALDIAMSGESDSGLTFGATFSLATGTSYAFADDDGFNAESAGSSAEVYLAGAFGKVAMKVDSSGLGQYKAYHEDDAKGYDLQYTHSVSGFDIGLRADVDGDAADGDYSLKLGYSLNGIALGANYDADGDWDLSAGYTMGSVTATLATDHASVHSLKLAYAANGISASAKFATDDSWKVTAGYEANGMNVAVETNQDSAWTIKGGYDLGGGASVAAGVNYADDAYLGVAFKF
jgi:outer membrane protein OmpU